MLLQKSQRLFCLWLFCNFYGWCAVEGYCFFCGWFSFYYSRWWPVEQHHAVFFLHFFCCFAGCEAEKGYDGAQYDAPEGMDFLCHFIGYCLGFRLMGGAMCVLLPFSSGCRAAVFRCCL